MPGGTCCLPAGPAGKPSSAKVQNWTTDWIVLGNPGNPQACAPRVLVDPKLLLQNTGAPGPLPSCPCGGPS